MQLKPFLLDAWFDQYEHDIEFNLAASTGPSAWVQPGLTFFDDHVINFFSPHAKAKSAIFLLAVGKPLKRKPQ